MQSVVQRVRELRKEICSLEEAAKSCAALDIKHAFQKFANESASGLAYADQEEAKALLDALMEASVRVDALYLKGSLRLDAAQAESESARLTLLQLRAEPPAAASNSWWTFLCCVQRAGFSELVSKDLRRRLYALAVLEPRYGSCRERWPPSIQRIAKGERWLPDEAPVSLSCIDEHCGSTCGVTNPSAEGHLAVTKLLWDEWLDDHFKRRHKVTVERYSSLQISNSGCVVCGTTFAVDVCSECGKVVVIQRWENPKEIHFGAPFGDAW